MKLCHILLKSLSNVIYYLIFGLANVIFLKYYFIHLVYDPRKKNLIGAKKLMASQVGIFSRKN